MKQLKVKTRRNRFLHTETTISNDKMPLNSERVRPHIRKHCHSVHSWDSPRSHWPRRAAIISTNWIIQRRPFACLGVSSVYIMFYNNAATSLRPMVNFDWTLFIVWSIGWTKATSILLSRTNGWIGRPLTQHDWRKCTVWTHWSWWWWWKLFLVLIMKWFECFDNGGINSANIVFTQIIY